MLRDLREDLRGHFFFAARQFACEKPDQIGEVGCVLLQSREDVLQNGKIGDGSLQIVFDHALNLRLDALRDFRSDRRFGER